ncbi:phosphate ABC transporter permease PstA [Anaerocolumna sedimenticola]|uniref:Phosphate transport system permease protein PstA n=1 Tax=Anaerocolumna sedimenticola TaxID=2696063 RepID=A0A6P1THW6_9FIRM|nr:phosphate ABC transporter permease PstA [Anaerocolumna sedimenticola]QHQ59682.1 phosphate ABC transporter permease PstA [Anaerocolumna sedimenticola]
MEKRNWNDRKLKDGILQGLIYLSTLLTVMILAVIIGFILYKGLPGINVRFLTRQWDDKTTFVNVAQKTGSNTNNNAAYVPSLGITLAQDGENIIIARIDSNSPVKSAVNMKKQAYALKEKDIITKYSDVKIEKMTAEKAATAMKDGTGTVRIKVIRPGGGIVPMLVSTIYIILLSLVIAAPIGISSAIYLNEYAKRGRILSLIRFAIQNLAGIPSIIYGLFGMLLFVQIAKMEYSVLAGALTLSILLLPTIISTTEEALKEIPKAYRESSFGLGATKLQTISRIILPGALPGILVAIILSIGRIVGESAALIWTAGTVAQIPGALVGGEASAATLTTKMYWLIKETADLSTASSIAVVLLALIIALNIASKMITRVFLKKRGTN